MVNNIYVLVFFVVGYKALYSGRQHNCRDPKPTINTLVVGRGRSRSSMHNSGIVVITQLAIGSHLFINL